MSDGFEKEIQNLRAEVEEYRKEKEQIRQVIGAIGGADANKRDKIFNFIFIVLLVSIFSVDILRHFCNMEIPYLSAMLSLEIGVLLVSIKIIWMIHKQAKVEHFQFWILNSIEFRLNAVSKKLRDIEKKLPEDK